MPGSPVYHVRCNNGHYSLAYSQLRLMSERNLFSRIKAVNYAMERLATPVVLGVSATFHNLVLTTLPKP